MINIQDLNQPIDHTLDFLEGVELAELHAHVGSSASAEVLWDIAHKRGLRLPTKSFNEFKRFVTLYERKSYEEYLLMFDLPELIQSSPDAMLQTLELAVAGAYRNNNTSLLELRFCPIFRVKKGERDMDYIIVYALQGIERAMLCYPIKSGLILELDRRLDKHENEAILKKAIKYASRGVIGLDLAGPVNRNENGKNFKVKDVADLFAQAREAGLGLTFHTGEITGLDEMWEVVELIKPERIGHGLAAHKDEALMKRLAKDNIILEICPTSNLFTSTIKNLEELKEILQKFTSFGVKFTINTDGPNMMQINLREEYRRLLVNNVLTEQELLQCNQIAKQATFIKS